jgi:hypothetical protein
MERGPVQLSAKYLGIWVGPGATNDQSFDGPVTKIGERMRMWSGFNLSTHEKIVVWNIYLLPLISYVAQVRTLTPSSNLSLLKILMRFVGGVHGWVDSIALGFFLQVVRNLYVCTPACCCLPICHVAC